MLVYGDTNSTLAGALAAVKLHIPVAHVEAGVRSFNRLMPEEINRVLTDHAADLLLPPTQAAADQLEREGISASRIHVVGDVMFDVALDFAERSAQRSSILQELELADDGYLLATIHRQENTDDPHRLEVIFSSLRELAKETPVVLPLHPRTRRALERAGESDEMTTGLRVIDPVGYLDMVALERGARLIVTDSGGRAEGGVLSPRAVRHVARRDGMDRVGRDWLEHASSPGRCCGNCRADPGGTRRSSRTVAG